MKAILRPVIEQMNFITRSVMSTVEIQTVIDLAVPYRLSPIVATSRASISSLCPQVRLMRKQASPSGTVGGRIAGTKIPCSRICMDSLTAR